MKITAHCLVKNEEKFIWYALNSVINHVEKVLVWDTGSTDRTVEIIKSIKSDKIEFAEKGPVDGGGVTRLRNEMIAQTKTDWIMILDGDEIWYENALLEIKEEIDKNPNKYSVIVVPTIMLIGDIFHKQEDMAGRYKIHDKKGHYNVRFVNKNIKGLRVADIYGKYPYESFVDSSETKVQEFPKEKIFFSREPYLHASHLLRSTKAGKKFKYEIGDSLPLDFYYPEVFFKDRPEIVPSPWRTMSLSYKFRALLETPLKKIKRRIV